MFEKHIKVLVIRFFFKVVLGLLFHPLKIASKMGWWNKHNRES